MRIDGQSVPARVGEILFAELSRAQVAVSTACHGKGICHLCRVHVLSSEVPLPPPNEVEERALGSVLLRQQIRLSCQLLVQGAMEVTIPQRYRLRR